MRKNFLSVTFLAIYCTSITAGTLSNDRNSTAISSKDGRFMVGLKGGLTFAQPIVFQKFNVINPLDNTISQSGVKSYKPFFQNIGYQYSFTALYQINNAFDIRLEPTFSTCIYKYNSSYFWQSTGTNSERIDMFIRHQQSLKYIEIPLTVRYLYGSGNVRPFLQGGLFYSYLLNAIKGYKRTESYTNGSGVSTLNSENETGDASPLYIKSRYGINAGIGVDYDLGAVHLTFDINFNVGINSVTNQAARYSAQQFSGGLYDVQDDIRLIVPSVNIGILFPLHKSARSKLNCPVKS
jgi:hypothetical protein